MSNLSTFIKYQRKKLGFTQEELASKAGVGIRFIREMEQGKETLQLDKINQVLSLVGFQLAPNKLELDPYDIALNYISDIKLHHFNKPVTITLSNKLIKQGFIIKEIIDKKENKITAWQFISNNNAIKYQQNKDNNLIETILHEEIKKIESQ